MKIIDVFRIAYSTFANNKMRTFLTIFGVSIGIGMIIFLVSIGYGLQRITIGEIQSIKALTTYNVTTGNSSILALNGENLEKLKSIENVISVSPLLSMSGQIEYEKKKTDSLVNAASVEYTDLESPKMNSGEIFKSDNGEKIIVTEVVANAFNIKPADLVGKKVTVYFYLPNLADSKNPTLNEKEYEISGVIKDVSAAYLYLPIGTINLAQDINYSAAKVKVKDSKTMSGVKEELIKLGYKTSSIGERINEINRIFNIVQIVLLIFGAIALIVASIGMFNTLTISLLERTRDIGIMKALGATDRAIYLIFLAESTLISLAGGILGIILSLVLGGALNIFVSILATKAGGEKVVIFQPPVIFVIVIFLFSFIVGLITGLYPSRRAAKLDPLDALRYE
ncbi:MAG: ABC transporter permease [Erysipelotrichaceae bacterium]|nr:ABC transporter permease [Erysipelotrichaceae bacterium]